MTGSYVDTTQRANAGKAEEAVERMIVLANEIIAIECKLSAQEKVRSWHIYAV